MGGQQTKGKTIEDFLKEYEEVRTEFDNRMGEVKIYKKIVNPEIQVMSKEKLFQKKSDYESFQRKISKRQGLSSENVAPLLLTISKYLKPNFVDNSRKEWCSEFFNVVTIYEYQDRTLEQVLRHRRSYNDMSMIVSFN